jgi:hypothetical protein
MKRNVRIVSCFVLVCLLLTASWYNSGTAKALSGFPSFVYNQVSIDPANMSYNPTGEFIFPSVIKATDYFSSPLGTYYMYYAPHNSPGGICLAYANSLNGPWTEYSSNPLISNVWSPFYSVSHVSSPHAIWNTVDGKLYLYFHGENSVTRVASSTDGRTFTYLNQCVSTADFDNISEASYARVFEYTIPSKGNKYTMLLMGNNAETRRIYLAWSNDGKTWATQRTPLISPDATEGGELSGSYFFPWNGGYYVVYHGGDGNMHITEVGANFNLENHLGVFYDSLSTAPDNARSAAPTFITSGTTIYMFYEAGQRGGTKIALAKANLGVTPTPAPTPTPTPASGWNMINDDLSNYTAGWGQSGTTGSITQNSGYVTIIDNKSSASGSYLYMIKNSFTPATGAFTFEVRAKANASGTTNEFSVRSASYLVSLYLSYGTSGVAQNKASSPTKTFTLNTTIYHLYRIVVHSNYTYDLYVDGVLAWSGAANLGSGTNMFKIGGDNTPIANLDLDSVKMGTGEILL